MANVTSARDKSIVNNDNDSARLILFRQLTPAIIRFYGVFQYIVLITSFSLVAIEINLLHGDLSVSRPRANSFFTLVSIGVKGLYVL